MKTYFFLISLLFVSLLSVSNSYAQKQDSLKQKQLQYYTKTLSISHDSSKLVVTIMDSYKESVKKVIADVTLTEEVKRVKIDDLIAEKNKKLELLLTPAQQAKIIPSTERKKGKQGK
jgi:hypothetical protein